MTAQATTATAATDTTADQTPTGDLKPQQPAPQAKANPEAKQGNQEPPKVEEDIQRAEKRLADKQAYIEELEGKLSNGDRNITDLQKRVKQQAEAIAPPQPEGQPGIAPDHAQREVATALGIDGDQLIGLLEKDPDKFVRLLNTAIGDVEKRASDRILGRIPEAIEQQRVVTETRDAVTRIRSELGEEGFSQFQNTLAVHQKQGFSPTPEQVRLEVEFGSTEMQRTLLEYGREAWRARQAAQAQATQSPGTPAPQAGQGQPRLYPMAPGRGSQVTPQAQAQDKKPTLAGIGWNIGK